jgi:ATP-dependent DNA helicase RecG
MLFYFDIENVELINVKGIAIKRKTALNQLGIFSLYDLFMYIPKGYNDRRKVSDIEDVENNAYAGIIITVLEKPSLRFLSKSKSITKLKAKSNHLNGEIIFFNAPYHKDKFIINEDYYIYGKIIIEEKIFKIINPISISRLSDLSSKLQIFPQYKLSSTNIAQNIMHQIQKKAFEQYGNYLIDILAIDILYQFNLMKIKDALYSLHFPKNIQDIKRAKDRLAFDEVFSAMLYLSAEKKERTRQKNNYIIKDNIFSEFKQCLNFKLTVAQINAIHDILADISQEKHVMSRLIQGDVGCGKTIVAFFALLSAAVSGYQALMLAPTEVLAKQHYENIAIFAKKFNVKIVLLTSSLKSAEREKIKIILREEDKVIAIGTHALFSEDILYRDLALIATDEQHKFGVAQRVKLANKGKNPHVLMMSATPIPRTLSLVMYANMDISIIDMMPPGRKPVSTYITSFSSQPKLYKYIERKVKERQQCYIVCATIYRDEDKDIFSLHEQIEDLERNLSDTIQIGCLHGDMSIQEKDKIIEQFSNKQISVLVATTVIEVGIDVRDATLIIINNAERFGLSQLHQLRGRVGRGNIQSECILLTDYSSDMVKRRISVLKNTFDGFEIAKQDLELRGPGEIFGYRQHGMFNFEYADIYNQPQMLFDAKEAVDMVYSNKKYDEMINKILEIFYSNQYENLKN